MARNGATKNVASTNFGFLEPYEKSLVLLAAQAETLFPIDPVASIVKVRLFADLVAQEAAARVGAFSSREENQLDLLRRLRESRALTREVEDVFHALRKAGNRAVHQNEGDHGDALQALKLARSLAIWFHRAFGKDKRFAPGPFVPPRPPADATEALEKEIERLRDELAAEKAGREAARLAAEEAERARASADERARVEAAERAAAEALMEELGKREAALAERLAETQEHAAEAPAAAVMKLVQRAADAGAVVELDEVATRRMIDEQLRAAGWDVDSATLRWAEGTRPQKGRSLAIAEWPTDDGPADYVLFLGLTPVAVVEAKRKRTDVSASIEQAKRYARGFREADGIATGGPWGKYRVPFLFTTNGRPYLEQIKTKSGIWFLDARRAANSSRPLVAWYSPEGLAGLLKQDLDEATAKLEKEPTDYLGLREYQLRAIKAAEEAVARGAQTAMLAMATGPGKTKTCIGLCYRLLKTGRFRRMDRRHLEPSARLREGQPRVQALLRGDVCGAVARAAQPSVWTGVRPSARSREAPRVPRRSRGDADPRPTDSARRIENRERD